MAAGDVVQGPNGEEIVLGEIGDRVVFENEHLRVWEVLLDPGGEQPWHRHHHPYLIVPLEAAENRITTLADGSIRDVSEEVGAVVFRPSGDVHKLNNRGETRYRSRLIELKDLS
jgi:predicted metal-dependent enzyme (double-stranded beta helix superfamily)